MINDFFLDDEAQFLHIHDKSRNRVWPTFYGHVKIVIMAMPVFIGAFAEYLPVLLFSPIPHPKLVGSIEAFNSSNINHSLSVCLRCSQRFFQGKIRVNIARIARFLPDCLQEPSQGLFAFRIQALKPGLSSEFQLLSKNLLCVMLSPFFCRYKGLRNPPNTRRS